MYCISRQLRNGLEQLHKIFQTKPKLTWQAVLQLFKISVGRSCQILTTDCIFSVKRRVRGGGMQRGCKEGLRGGGTQRGYAEGLRGGGTCVTVVGYSFGEAHIN